MAPDLPLAGPAVAVLHILRPLTADEATTLADRLTDVACELGKGEHRGEAERIFLSVTLLEDDA